MLGAGVGGTAVHLSVSMVSSRRKDSRGDNDTDQAQIPTVEPASIGQEAHVDLGNESGGFLTLGLKHLPSPDRSFDHLDIPRRY